MTPITLTSRNDPNRPNLVWAPAPHDKTRFVRLLTNPETVAKMYATGRGAAIGQYEALVLGIVRRATAFGEVSELATGGLVTAVALFRRLRRPMIDLDLDAETFV